MDRRDGAVCDPGRGSLSDLSALRPESILPTASLTQHFGHSRRARLSRVHGLHALQEPKSRTACRLSRGGPLASTHQESQGNFRIAPRPRSEEHTSELQSLMRISYAVFCLKKKNTRSTL